MFHWVKQSTSICLQMSGNVLKNLLIIEVKVSGYTQNKHWESGYLSLILNALSLVEHTRLELVTS